MLQQKNIDNHRFVVKKSFETRNGLIAEGTEIVMFNGIMYVNGVCVLPQYQAEIKSVLLRAEEDLKEGKQNEYLKIYPWQPTAVY